jgi:hypothetical protein
MRNQSANPSNSSANLRTENNEFQLCYLGNGRLWDD